MSLKTMEVVRSFMADVNIQFLGPDDRAELETWLERLQDWDHDPIVRERSHKLFEDDNAYVLHAGPVLRVYFRLQPERIEVVGVTTKAAILHWGRTEAGQ